MKFLLFVAFVFLHVHLQSIDFQSFSDSQLSLLQANQMKSEVIAEFPFSAYEVIHSASQGSFYVDVPNLDFIKAILSSNQTWEPEILQLIQSCTQPNTIMIDIGAHIGTHTMAMSRSIKENGLVLAFEPQAKIHRELVLNLKLNQCENVIPIHAALGAENGEAYLEPVRSDNEGYRCISSKRLAERISVLKLDDFQLFPVSCMKIDAESYELEILQGAYDTIMRNKPTIIIEIGGGWSREEEENIDPKKHLATVIDVLESVFNYEVTLIPGRRWDYLAIPKN